MRRAVLLGSILFTALAAQAAAQSLPGQILDAATGAPLAARIDVLETNTGVAAGADGRFSLDTSGAGRLTLAVSHAGYYVQRVTIDVETAASVEVRLTPIVSLTDRIEVTASRAREGADPASFTNITQEEIAEAHWGQDPAVVLSQMVPGLYATNDNGNGIGYSYFSIRGFGQARTRVMLNGAPLNDAESGELFFIDLADFLSTGGDVQVQRGVFGLSGLGGAIDMTTAWPGVEPAFSVQAGAGSFGTRRLALVWNSGLVGGKWALAARYSRISSDGYRDQSWVDMWNYYLSLAHYGERSRLRAVVFGGPEDTHLAYNGVTREVLDGGLTGDADRDRRHNPLTYPGEIDYFFQPHYQLVHEIDFSDRTHFRQTLYTFQGDGYYDQFKSRRWLVEYDLPSVSVPGGADITRSDLVRRRTVDEWDAGWVPSFSHEAGRLSLDLAGEVRVHRGHHFGEVTWAQYYPVGVAPNHRYYDYRVAKNTLTGALTARYALSPRLRLTGGLQVAHHTYGLHDDKLKGVTVDEPFTFVLPRAGVVLALSERDDAYVSVARGMREPFLRSIYDPQDYYSAPASLDPEDVWNVEAGVSLRRGRWRARANAFWMNFRNEIVYAGALDENGVPIYGNGARSKRRGVEMDGSLAVTPRLSLDGTLSVGRHEFTRYREHDYEGGVAIYDGNRVAGFPDVMASAAVRAEVRRAIVSLAVRRVGRFYLDNTGDETRINPAYTVADASARVPVPGRLLRVIGVTRLEVDLRLNNLFDRKYTTFGYVDGVPLYIPAAGRNFYAGLAFSF